MIATIIQTPYLPWLGFFDRVLKSDVLILLDNVAMDRNSRTKFLNRNRVRTKDAWTWLTVPLVKGGRSTPIHELRIKADERWSSRHWRAIVLNYSRATHYRRFMEEIRAVYDDSWDSLVELNEALMGILLAGFGIAPRIEHASRLGAEGTGGELLIELCRRVGATSYISGPLGRGYINREAFRAGRHRAIVPRLPTP